MRTSRWRGAFWAFAFLITMVSTETQAQFSNDWINFSQTYYKIPVAKDGIYRISYADLQSAGVPLGSIDPRRINLFYRGREQAIFVQGQADAQFDTGDYIEFYGQRNDGTLDADLYKPFSLQPHRYYNLFSDTSAYFLTWNPLPVSGKRMTAFSEANISLPKETFHTEEQRVIYFNEYSGGLTQANGEIQSTAFDQGEGWTGPSFCTGLAGCTGMQDLVIENLARGVTAGGNPQLELLLVGRYSSPHAVDINAGPNGGSLRFFASASFTGYETKLLNFPLNWSDIGPDGKMTVRVRITTAGSIDMVSASYVRVTFPQDFSVNSQTQKIFRLAPNAGNKSYVEFSNVPGGSRIWDITDPNAAGTIGSVATGGGIGAVVPSTASSRTLLISSVVLSSALQKVSFRSIAPGQSNFIVISHHSLMKPALGYSNAVQAYAGYRASQPGGSYDTLTVSVDQLYNQFNYGETSPRAIFQFMKFLVNGGKPRFLFLIGKGLEASQGFYRKTSLSSTDFRDLVPAAGVPGADMAFTAGLNGTTYEPAVATGRLTASDPIQVAAYLNKVKETEATPFNDLWRKNLLHLSGGINPGEPETFRSYVDGFKAIGESFYLGGKAGTISKQTLNVELINVKDEVNKGLNLVTFFGHSGPGTIDINIGYVSDPSLGYNNPGKYPGFLINGCNAGRFFDNRVTFGEDWMLTANKGAKAFIAHSYFGFDGTLKQYSDLFYSLAYGDSTFMKKGIGEVQQETARRYLANYGHELSSVTQVQQMVLLGDPAVQLFPARYPDYEINNGSVSVVSLDGKPVTAQSPAFGINIHVRNFGRAQPGQMKIRVTRKLTDNSVVTYDSLFGPVLYEQTLTFLIRKGRNNNEAGDNGFTVTIDPEKSIPELDKSNNTAGLTFFVPLNGTKNLFPAPFSIVNTTSVNLLFQHTDLLAGVRSFRIEIDTASTFDSPWLSRKTVSGKVLAKLPMTLLAEDSLVYYWRTKLDQPLPGESTDWVISSFKFIQNGPEGWAQTQFPQLLQNNAEAITLEEDIRRIKFLETVSTVAVKTVGGSSATPVSDVSLKINGEEINPPIDRQCRTNTLNFVAFDKNSTAAYPGIPFQYFDYRICGREPQLINSFQLSEMETGQGDDIAQWVYNIQQGDSVLMFSIGDAGYSSWSSGLKLQLSQLGLATDQLDGILAGEPFVVLGKKGGAYGTARVFRPTQSPPAFQDLAVDKTVTGSYSKGSMTSVTVGPAQAWSKFFLQVTGATSSDIYGVDVTAMDLAGNESVVRNRLLGTEDLTDIDAVKFPYLKLVFNVQDDVDLTPVQLRKWMVTYTPMAEGVLTYAGKTDPETVQEGQAWSSAYGFTNISSRKFQDSVLVQLDVFSTEQKSAERKMFRIKSPLPGDTTRFSVSTKTKGKGGPNDVTVFVNPRNQPEQYYDNNILPLYGHLIVEADKTSPVLDVTIDGRKILDGDAVSSSPSIVLNVIDRNPFLPKTDTTGINLYLKYPCDQKDCPYKRIDYSRDDVSWKPATSTTDFQARFTPSSLPPGSYQLKAEATDASGNSSGDEPYEISFFVKDEFGVTLMSVYPNPSRDLFYFKLLLTGPSAPDDFQLQIFSSTGAEMRRVGNEVLKSFFVGTNVISLPVVDADGNRLPPGVYVFRMITVMNGRQFTKGGKLVVPN